MYPMLHTKFQGHRCIGSGEEVFLNFYHIWAWRSCKSCDPEQPFVPLAPGGHIGNWVFMGSMVSEKKFESMD